MEGYTIGDLDSFLTGDPAIYTMDALEDAELVLIRKSSHEVLLKILPQFETYNFNRSSRYDKFSHI